MPIIRKKNEEEAKLDKSLQSCSKNEKENEKERENILLKKRTFNFIWETLLRSSSHVQFTTLEKKWKTKKTKQKTKIRLIRDYLSSLLPNITCEQIVFITEYMIDFAMAEQSNDLYFPYTNKTYYSEIKQDETINKSTSEIIEKFEKEYIGDKCSYFKSLIFEGHNEETKLLIIHTINDETLMLFCRLIINVLFSLKKSVEFIDVFSKLFITKTNEKNNNLFRSTIKKSIVDLLIDHAAQHIPKAHPAGHGFLQYQASKGFWPNVFSYLKLYFVQDDNSYPIIGETSITHDILPVTKISYARFTNVFCAYDTDISFTLESLSLVDSSGVSFAIVLLGKQGVQKIIDVSSIVGVNLTKKSWKERLELLTQTCKEKNYTLNWQTISVFEITKDEIDNFTTNYRFIFTAGQGFATKFKSRRNNLKRKTEDTISGGSFFKKNKIIDDE